MQVAINSEGGYDIFQFEGRGCKLFQLGGGGGQKSSSLWSNPLYIGGGGPLKPKWFALNKHNYIMLQTKSFQK